MSIDLVGVPQPDVGAAKAFASELIARAGDEASFDAASLLREYPQLAEHRSIVVDLAYEEFCRRRDSGEQPDPKPFARRFPLVEQSLLRVLEVHEFLDRNPNAFINTPSPIWPEAGDELLGFALDRELGRGGFSRVFLAKETALGNRTVVVKVCGQTNDEAFRLGQLNHRNIVPVYSVRTQQTAGLTAICMPYLGDVTLEDVRREVFAAGAKPSRSTSILNVAGHQSENTPVHRSDHPLAGNPEIAWVLTHGSYGDAIIEIGAQLCEALTYAHSMGIYHCDVKPSNVLLTADGQSKLFDFNLSIQRGGAAAAIGGTLPYMAPEQLRCLIDDSMLDSPSIDHRSDLFSLGVTLFQLITGKTPFHSDDLDGARKQAAGTLLARQQANDVPVDQLEEAVGPQMSRVICDCLAFDPADRPQSAESVARSFRYHVSQVSPDVRRRRSRKLAATAAGLFCTAVGLAVLLLTRPPAHVRDYQRGLASMSHGDASAATEHFSAALFAQHDFSEAHIARGWAKWNASKAVDFSGQQRSELRQSATADFLASWKLAGSAEAVASLAYCQSQMNGDFRSAVDCYELAITNGFHTAAVYNNLGACYWQLGELKEAVAALQRAVELNPRLQIGHYNLAMVELRMAHADRDQESAEYYLQAVEHIERALELGAALPRLEIDAACVYGGAFSQFDNDEYLEQSLEFCKRAVDHCVPRRYLNEVLVYVPSLVTDPRFYHLRARASADGTIDTPTPQVDMYPDIQQRLVDVFRLAAR